MFRVMLLDRAEEWCVEAETVEEARIMIARGKGRRCKLGTLPIQFDQLQDET